MSPADAQAISHIATDVREMSDTDLNRLARKNACLPGVNAAAIRHEIDKEQEYRRAYRHRMDTVLWSCIDGTCPDNCPGCALLAEVTS